MNARYKCSVLISLFVAIVQMTFVRSIWAQTAVPGGDVSGTWTVQGSPYQIEGDITIPNDSVLVVEPGVTVEFQGHFELLVNGRLLAIGTEADSIVFTISDTTGWSDPGNTLGGWKHIRLFEPLVTNDSTILDYCRIQYGKAIGPNWPFNHGGAVSVVGFDKVRISHCLIVNNMSGGDQGPVGGGIGVTYCDIAIIGNTIAYNHSHAGGGIHISQSNSIFKRNTIRGNTAIGNGGGIEIAGDISRPAVITFLGDSIVDNRAGPGGGGMHAFDVDSLVLDSVVIRGNYANWGGGVGSYLSTLFLTDCVLGANTCGWLGAGIAADYCTLIIRWTQFLRNTSQDGAGAMHNDHCEVLVANSSFYANESGNDTLGGPGGGINAYATSLEIEYCDFVSNVTGGIGGAISADSTALSVEGANIAFNGARYAGGGIHIINSTLDLRNSSLWDNTAGNDTIGGIGGGIRSVNVSGEINDCHIDSNLATGGGGGIATLSDVLSLDGTTFCSNRALWNGGGVEAIEGSLVLESCEVMGNVVGNDTISGSGGGLRTADGTVHIRNCRIDSNRSTGGGGGIATLSDSLSLDGTTISSNHSLGSGGGIVAGFGHIRLTNSDLVGNVAGNDTLGGNGGGMEAIFSDVALAGGSISSNTASSGGGLNIYNCDLDIQDGLFERNRARFQGGALLYSEDTTYFGRPYQVSIEHSTFDANTSANQTGGAHLVQSSVDSSQVALTIDRCIFRENEALSTTALRIIGLFRNVRVTNSVIVGNRSGRQAAGVGMVGAWGIVANCLFARNVAGSDTVNASGSGLSATQHARVDMVNCTFAHNDASAATSLSMRTGAWVWLTNSVMWGNTGPPISLVTGGSPEGCHLWVNHSLIEHGADSVRIPDSLSILHWGVRNIDANPLFADSASEDYHLSASSPCIGAGVDSIEIDGHWFFAPGTDLEGNPRPAPSGTKPDLGAYEDGVTIPAAVDRETEGNVPVSFMLYQNHPNPFNPATTIRFDLPERSPVRLEIFDLLGARVAVLLDEVREAGRWSVVFSQSGLASGVYVYRLTAGAQVFTEKMLLVR